jgi:pimeloyl-ACP methyl ester carboxylesterase
MTEQLRPGPSAIHNRPMVGWWIRTRSATRHGDGLAIQASTAPGSHVQGSPGGGAAALDPARARALMGQRWEASQAYNLDRARTPSVQAANRRMLRELGTKTISPQDLARIAVPTSLIWGRQDRVMRLRIAEAASTRYGWPLHVIEDAGHFSIEQPEAFRAALWAALGNH